MSFDPRIWCPDCGQATLGGCFKHVVIAEAVANVSQIIQGLDPKRRSHHPEKCERLWALGWRALDLTEVALAEQLEIRVKYFSTGVGELTHQFVDNKIESVWRHEIEAWVNAEDYAAIKCLHTITVEESGFEFTMLTGGFTQLEARIYAATRAMASMKNAYQDYLFDLFALPTMSWTTGSYTSMKNQHDAWKSRLKPWNARAPPLISCG